MVAFPGSGRRASTTSSTSSSKGRLLAVAAVMSWLVVVVACSSGAGGTGRIAVPTQSRGPTLGPGATPASCTAAVLEGTLVRDERWGIAVKDGTGAVREVAWPAGYYGLDEGPGALVDQDDRVVAGVGDRVRVGGGEAAAGSWIACPGQVDVLP